MNVLIISTNRNLLPFPVMPLGACTVAEAAERGGHAVRLLDLMFEKDPIRAVEASINKSGPDIVGLSVRNIDNNDMQNPIFFIEELLPLIEAIRKNTGTPIVLGGSALGVMPEELMRYTGISCAVPGDGEVVFPQLLAKLSSGENVKELAGVAWLEGNEFKYSPRPFDDGTCFRAAPDLPRWINVHKYLSRLAAVPVQTKLGCHFKCVYCTYRKIEGNRYRIYDLEGVISAVKRLASSGLRDIEFVDNVFNSPNDHALALCEGLAASKSGARLHSLELNPLFIDDHLITSMEKAGFKGIGVTVESASERVLTGLGKGYTTGDIYRAADVIGRHKLPCLWIFLLGGPGETKETVRETLRFAERSIARRDTAFFNIGIRIYPGTELESIAREHGVLSLPKKDMLKPVFYISPEIDTDIEEGSRWILKQVKDSMNKHMNFINSDSIGSSYLHSIQSLGYRLGLSSPIWRHTRFIRRSLRFMGIDA